MSLILIAYVIVGFVAGLLSGLLGLGGGVVIVPSLLVLFSWQQFPEDQLMHLATGTSLATVVITSLMTTWVQSKQKSVQWAVLTWLIPGMVLGALGGIVVGNFLPGAFLKSAFAFFCLLLGVKMLLATQSLITPEKKAPPKVLAIVLAIFIGMCAGLLGIGGGVLVIPLLLWYGLEVPQVSATSAACALPTAASGAITAMVVGWHTLGLPAKSLGFVYWPAAVSMGIASLFASPIGVWLVHRLPVAIVKRIFGGILLIIAATMMPSF